MANDSYTELNLGSGGSAMDESSVAYGSSPTDRRRARVVISGDSDASALASPVNSSMSVTGSQYGLPVRLVGSNPVTVYDSSNSPISFATQSTLQQVADNTGRLPITGSAVSANSMPVVLSTDHAPITVTGSLSLSQNANVAVSNFPATQSVTGSLSLSEIATIKSVTSTSSSVSQIAAAAVNTTLLNSNTSRQMATFYNDSSSRAYLKLGQTASTTSYTVKLEGGSYYEIPFRYTGIIDCIWDSATGNMYVTELS